MFIWVWVGWGVGVRGDIMFLGIKGIWWLGIMGEYDDGNYGGMGNKIMNEWVFYCICINIFFSLYIILNFLWFLFSLKCIFL